MTLKTLNDLTESEVVWEKANYPKKVSLNKEGLKSLESKESEGGKK